MRRAAERAIGWQGLALGAALALCALAAPSRAAAQAQESIEIGRLEVEDARQILGCFRTYLRGPRKPGADERLRTCVTRSHGRVATVTVPTIRRRVRCLAAAIRRVMLAIAHAETHGTDRALDEARTGLAECAIEAAAGPLRASSEAP